MAKLNIPNSLGKQFIECVGVVFLGIRRIDVSVQFLLLNSVNNLNIRPIIWNW